MTAPRFTPSTSSTDETADDLVARLMGAIHEHAEDHHSGRGGPEINGPLVVAALARTLAELLLNVPPCRLRDELVAFHASALQGVLRTAATGEAVDLTFTAVGAAH